MRKGFFETSKQVELIAKLHCEPFNQDRSKGIWVAERPHLMLLLPASMMDDLPRDPYAGGPYVMWDGSDFVHVMVPLEVTEPLK